MFSKLTRKFHRDIFGRFEPRIWIITGINILTTIGFSICFPFLALYLYQERGLSMTLVGIMFLVGGLFSGVTQMVGGVLSDRYGRRPVLLWATLAGTLLFSGLATLVGISAPVWIIVVVYLAGRSVLVTIRPTSAAVVADLSPRNLLTETYGLLRVGGNVGFAIGPALGGFLLTVLPYAWLFWIAVLTNGISLLLIFLFLKESFKSTGERADFRSTLSVARDWNFLVFTALTLLAFLAMGQLGSTLSVFAVDRMGISTAQYGLLLTCNGLIVVIFQYPVARGLNRITISLGLILGSLLYAFGYLSLGWITSFGWLFGAVALVTAGEMVFSPVTLSVVTELSPENWRGRYMGFFELSHTLGMSLGPLVGGILLDVFPTDPRFIWGTIASMMFAAALGFQWWGRRATSPVRLNSSIEED
ncbi:MDR family MFS transporter [Chloroflexota bacterium]